MSEFYSVKEHLYECQYNIFIGKRSNGKTYSSMLMCVEEFFKTGKRFVYMRRYHEDIVLKRMQRLFEELNFNGTINQVSNGQYDGIHFYGGQFYPCNFDDNGKAVYDNQNSCGYAMALNDSEHDKSGGYPNVKYIIFDEFISRNLYLRDEFIVFMNAISTVKRSKKDVMVIMLGNTINKFCPYFKEMGIHNIYNMKLGTTDVYRYGESSLKVAMHYISTKSDGEAIDDYFAFNNPKLEMIVKGSWELPIYPRIKESYSTDNVVQTFFIKFENKMLQVDFVVDEKRVFLYVYPKTTEIRDGNALIFGIDKQPYILYNNIYANMFNFEKQAFLIRNGKVFFSDNETGNLFHNFLKESKIVKEGLVL